MSIGMLHAGLGGLWHVGVCYQLITLFPLSSEEEYSP